MNVVQELNGATPTANLLTSLGIDETLLRTDAVGARSSLADGLGSTLALTDAAGLVQSEYTYEPFGKTIATGVASTNGTTPTANLLTSLGIDETLLRTDSAGARSFLSDGLGSTLALTDSAGLVQSEYTYEPFGKTSASGITSTNAFKYTGREDDGTGLYYYRARYYHPTLQRFISEDPIGFAGGDVNLYGYVFNDPINLVDPEGLFAGWLGWLGRFFPRVPPPPPGYPNPPGWTSGWQWRYPECTNPRAAPRWFDPEGGEWRWHAPDKWHPKGHWDYNPWEQWNSPWQNVPGSFPPSFNPGDPAWFT